jgi:3-keto-L-gulonate-6-phosphate decarboxylase
MKLQVAFDVKKYDYLKKIMESIYPYVDILEIGTLLIKSEGINVVKKAKIDYGLPVFADLKCMDAGKFETEISVENGADYVTVLATSYDKNIKEVIDVCKEYNVKSVADSINCPIDRVVKIQDFDIDVVELHTGYLNEVGVRPWDDIKEFYPKATKPIFISGGISSKNLKEIQPYVKKIDAVVVGRTIINSINPKEEARKIREILESF